MNDESCGCDGRYAGDGGEYLEPALQLLTVFEELVDLCVDELWLGLDLGQSTVVEALGEGMAQVLVPVGDSGPVADQRIAHLLQVGEAAVDGGLRRRWAQAAYRADHHRQRPGINGVGLGATSRDLAKHRTW